MSLSVLTCTSFICTIENELEINLAILTHFHTEKKERSLDIKRGKEKLTKERAFEEKKTILKKRKKKPSRGGLEVERPLRIQLKAGHSYLGGFESCLGHGYVDVICNIISLLATE